MKLVLVEWVDSSVCGGWDTLDGIRKHSAKGQGCRSVGWVSDESEATLVVVPHLTDDSGVAQGAGAMAIPRVAIQSIEVLDSGEPRRTHEIGGMKITVQGGDISEAQIREVIRKSKKRVARKRPKRR